MSDQPKRPPGVPPNAIHLGTLTFKGSGQFSSGVLKLWNDPEEDLFDTARSFYQAADRCLTGNRIVPGIDMLTVPGAVCAALACELFLKFAHLKESGQTPRGHDLLDLFTSLPELAQKGLVTHRADVAEVLERNRAHFADARYHHEHEQFSFRQQELLEVAETLNRWTEKTYRKPPEARNDGT